MADRVFDQRLQDHARHHGVQGVRREVKIERDPLLKPDVLDFKVLLNKLQLLSQSNFVLSDRVDRQPEQIA